MLSIADLDRALADHLVDEPGRLQLGGILQGFHLEQAAAEDFERAIQLLRRVLADITCATRLGGSFSDRFKGLVRRVLSTTLFLSTRQLGVSAKAFPTDDVSKERIESLLAEAIQADPSNPAPYLGSAIAKFWGRRFKAARLDVKMALRCGSPNDPAPYLSLAFLDFYQRQLDAGWQHLRRAIALGGNLEAETLMNVIVFYEDVLEKEPERFELLLPLGVLSKEFTDSGRAREVIEEFRSKLVESNYSASLKARMFSIVEEQLADLP